MPVDGDRLIHVHGTDGGITGRFQPSGDSHRSMHLAGVGAGTGHPDDDRRLQPVDRVGADAQQACSLGVYPGGSAGPFQCVLGVVHACMDGKAPGGMRSR